MNFRGARSLLLITALWLCIADYHHRSARGSVEDSVSHIRRAVWMCPWNEVYVKTLVNTLVEVGRRKKGHLIPIQAECSAAAADLISRRPESPDSYYVLAYVRLVGAQIGVSPLAWASAAVKEARRRDTSLPGLINLEKEMERMK